MTDREFPAAIVFEMLHELEREVRAVGEQIDEVARANRAGDPIPAAALTGVRTSIALTGSKIELLRARSLELVESSSDLAILETRIRARTNLVLAQLEALAHVRLAARLFIGRFASLRDVSAHLVARIGAINARWVNEHRLIRASDAGPRTRETLLRVALVNAELAMSLIAADDPDLAHFLRAGTASSRPALREPCRVIAAIVGR